MSSSVSFRPKRLLYGLGTHPSVVANLLVAIHNVASAEAMVLGMKAGLAPQQTLDLVTAGAGNSRVFELRAPMMVADRYDEPTMKVSVWQKDMSVIGDYAQQLNYDVDPATTARTGRTRAARPAA